MLNVWAVCTINLSCVRAGLPQAPSGVTAIKKTDIKEFQLLPGSLLEFKQQFWKMVQARPVYLAMI